MYVHDRPATTHRRPPRDPFVSGTNMNMPVCRLWLYASFSRQGPQAVASNYRGARANQLCFTSPHLPLTHRPLFLLSARRRLSWINGRAACGAVLQDLPPPRSPGPRRRSPRFVLPIKKSSVTSYAGVLSSSCIEECIIRDFPWPELPEL
jgi:hypothetical protein